jgi:hypothetical protein
MVNSQLPRFRLTNDLPVEFQNSYLQDVSHEYDGSVDVSIECPVLSEKQYNGEIDECFYRSGWNDTMDVKN